MDRTPLDQQTVETVFTNNENFKTYMWQFYVNRSFMVYDYSNYNADLRILIRIIHVASCLLILQINMPGIRL